MIKKMMILTMIFVGILNAANVTVNKNTYNPNEQIRVHFSGMTAKNDDWIGIYPANKNNDWDNVVAWKWTEDTTAGDLTFAGLPAGTYDVRAFYNNSFHLEAHKQFTVTGNVNEATVTTNKATYNTGETVTATFNHMSGDAQDWMGIYPAGSTNDWGNVVQWAWTDGRVQGSKTFKNLPNGNYEVRVFFRNSFNLEARHAFKVEGAAVNTTVTTNKATYTTGETVRATFNHMSGDAQDWMGIYPAGSTNAWGNVVQWAWTDGQVQGTKTFNNLPDGDYEVRVFFRNSFKLEASHPFKVEGPILNKIVYETAENGLDQVWDVGTDPADPKPIVPVKVINQGAGGSAHAARVQRDLTSIFSFNHPNKRLKFLELDVRVGISSHVGNFAVYVNTSKGEQRVLFSPYMNHPGNIFHNDPARFQKPFISNEGNMVNYNNPAPSDYFMLTRHHPNTANFIHYKINIEETMRILDPDIQLLSITAFSSAGGDFDNIQLVSH